ncbi:MAG TPA: iron ABC transporter permease [Burkholderiales bacterium]|nr:iron ABC transporter permease [Burkholderiales bacterium]
MTSKKLLSVLSLLAIASLILALSAGSFGIAWDRVLQGSGLDYELFVHLRLPRAANAFTTGALLALSGALMQVMLRNPLADPYVLGISGGAAVAALFAMLLGFASPSLAAFIGAMVSMLLVFGISGFERQARLLLTGIVVASGWGALIALILSISPQAQLRGMLFWLMGNLNDSGSPYPGLIALFFGLLFVFPMAKDLNVLSRGDHLAMSLGVSVKHLQWKIYFICALLTSVAVMTAGSIGFVGLIVPHGLRKIGGRDHRILLPGAALLGGTLLLLADTLARTAAAPQQLPVGAIMALIGVPIFLYLLAKP